MRIKINDKNNKITYYSISVFLMLFYCYNYTMADILYRNKLLIYASFAISVVACVIPMLKGKKMTFDTYTFLWCGCLFFALYNNQRIKLSDFAPKMMCWFAMIICMLILRDSVSWISVTIKWIYIFTIIHVIFAWVFKFFPALFFRFSNLYSGVNRATMLNHYNNGYLLGITTHYSTLAIYLGNGLVVIAALFLLEKNLREKRKQLFLLIAISITLAMIGKRGMLVFVLLSLIIFTLLVRVRDIRKLIPVLVKYLMMFVAIVAIFILLANTVMPQLLVTLNRFIHIAEGTDFTNGRGKMWGLAIELFCKKPLLGVGWFGYREYYSVAWYHGSIFQKLDTHNVYLQLLSETGIIGFMLFVGTMFSTLFMSIRDLRKCIFGMKQIKEEYSKVLSISVIVQILFLLYCLTGNPLYDPQNFIVYFLVITIEYSLHGRIKELV